MENKEPKEIWIDTNSALDKIWLLEKRSDTDTKYLSSTHVEEILSSKDKEIERLKQEVDSLKGKNTFLNDHIITITESNNQAFDELKKHYQGNNNQVLFVAEEMKWCDCKNLEKSTANFMCHGQCKY